jgi:HlyD family secretion protein
MEYKKFIKKNKVYIGLGVVVLLILSYYVFSNGNGEPEYDVYQVSYGSVRQEVSETGIVRPAKMVNMAFETSGTVNQIKVKEGDKVSIGRELISLDKAQLGLRVSEASAALQTAQASLDKVLAGASAEDIKVYETAVANAETNLLDIVADAESDLEQAYEDMMVDIYDAYVDCDDAVRNKVDQFIDNPRGSNPQLQFTSSNSSLDADIENKRYLLETALISWLSKISALSDSTDLEAYIDTAEKNINEVNTFLNKVSLAVNDLTPNTTLSQTTIDTWKAAVATARANVSATLSTVVNQKQTISTTKITNEKNINTAQATLDTARDNLALKKAAPREADLALAEAQVNQAKAALALAQENYSKGTLRSPIDGIVTKIGAEVGEVVAMNVPVVSVDSGGDFQIEVDVYEEDIPWVEIGDPVDVEVVAFPDDVLTGRVASINPAEKLVGGVVYYEVEISFDGEERPLRNGMTADIVIMTDERRNVLVVPKGAVSKRNAVRMVDVLEGEVVKERAVEIGLEGTDGNIEIISGLSEGEQVVLR